MEHYLRTLTELYVKKKSFLEEMLNQTAIRFDLDEVEQFEEILSYIEARQYLIDQIDLLNTEIELVNNNLLTESNDFEGDKLSGITATFWKEISGIQESFIELIAKIQFLDQQQKLQIERQLLVTEKQHEKLKDGRRAINAYVGKPRSQDSVFIDQKK